jgi:hypothetical protein
MTDKKSGKINEDDFDLEFDFGEGLADEPPSSTGAANDASQLIPLDDDEDTIDLTRAAGTASAGASDSDLLSLEDFDLDDSDLDAVAKGRASGTKSPSSDVALDAAGSSVNSSDLSLAGDSGVSKKPKNPAGGASIINLDSDDDEYVLGAGDSDITLQPSESGIGIGSNISGVSLGDSGLDLGSDTGFDLGSGVGSGAGGDDSAFMLTPLEDMEGEESDDSGSQVIALDDESGEFGSGVTMLGAESSGPMLGGEPAGLGSGLGGGLGSDSFDMDAAFAGHGAEPNYGAQAQAAPAALAVEPIILRGRPETRVQFGALGITGLSFTLLFLVLGGLFMFELMRSITVGTNSVVMDAILGMF